MSKQDYILIAAVLAETPRVERESRRLLAEAFASALASGNPRFNRERFLAAALRHDEH
jgi:hypothetical protein